MLFFESAGYCLAVTIMASCACRRRIEYGLCFCILWASDLLCSYVLQLEPYCMLFVSGALFVFLLTTHIQPALALYRTVTAITLVYMYTVFFAGIAALFFPTLWNTTPCTIAITLLQVASSACFRPLVKQYILPAHISIQRMITVTGLIGIGFGGLVVPLMYTRPFHQFYVIVCVILVPVLVFIFFMASYATAADCFILLAR